jgi:predicted esterase
MRAEVGELFEAERFAEAATILEEILRLYPEHMEINCYNLALVRVRLGRPDEGLAALSYGLDQGVWFGKYAFFEEVWTPIRKAPGWAEFHHRNEAARARAQEVVEPRLEVALPQGYDPSRSYPLFLALHGGGENVDVFMPNWVSPALKRDFITAYPQSTRLILTNGYGWTEDMDLSLQEIQTAFDEMVRRYAVDPGRVLVGGFSSGGVAALEIVLRNAFPVRGFVVLCPAVPEGLSPGAVRAARERGIRGTLITTEQDHRVNQQIEMAEMMRAEGFSLEFSVLPNIGHWYPDDFAERLDRAIAHIWAGRGEGGSRAPKVESGIARSWKMEGV